MSQFPAWAAGSKITAGGLTQMEDFVVIKGAPTSVTSSTTLIVDPDLQIPITTSGGTFIFDAFLLYTGAAVGTGDLKLTFVYTGTSSNTLFGVNGITTSSTTSVNMGGNGFTGTSALGSNGGNFVTCQIQGSFQISTAGTLEMQWAQNTSSATATQLKTGCWLRLQQIA